MNNPISRRSFLALSAAGVATAASNAKVYGANDRIRIGVIGCGARGMELLNELLRLNAKGHRVEVAAVCDVWSIRRHEARARVGALAFQQWRAIIERTDIDAVVIATPDHWHAPMAIAAMQSGKDVYCESPMTRTFEEAKALRDTARTTGRIVQVGAQTTFEDQWHIARELVAAGKIGRVIRSEGSHRALPPLNGPPRLGARPNPNTLDWKEFLGSAPERAYKPERFFGWRNFWDYSGDVADLNYDRIAPLILATGTRGLLRVTAAGGVKHKGGEVPDAFMMTARYSNGHTIVLSTTTPSTLGMPAVVRGESAYIEFRSDRIQVTPERRGFGVSAGDASTAETVAIPAGAARHHLVNWLAAVREDGTCICNAELGFEAMTAVAMSVDAYRRKRALYFNAASESVSEQPPPGTPRIV